MLPRRQPLAAGPDMPPMAPGMGAPIAAAPALSPMQFAPIEQQQGGQPDLGPLMMALTQRLSQNAQMGSSSAVDAPMRKKPEFGGMMDRAGGGYA